MESQVHFDHENFFHIKITAFPEGNEKFYYESLILAQDDRLRRA